MKQQSAAEFKNNLFAAYNERLLESLKRALSRKDSTIDWSKAEMIVDFEIAHVHIESKSKSVHQQIEDAFKLVMADTKKWRND